MASNESGYGFKITINWEHPEIIIKEKIKYPAHSGVKPEVDNEVKIPGKERNDTGKKEA